VSVPAYSPLHVNPDKIIHRAVIPCLDVTGKIAGRQFTGPPVGGNAIAADPLFSAWVTAIAVYHVSLFVTFHGCENSYFSLSDGVDNSFFPVW
jgi:hypothetical protein